MTTHKRLGRLAAGASALALLGAGLIGTAASAEPGPGQDGAPETGSLTLYKKTPVGGDDPTTKTPVVGVTFEACLIDGIDLEDPASWDGLDELDPADVAAGTTCFTDVTDDDGKAEFPSLPIGAYLVTETDVGDNLVTTAAAPFIVTIPRPDGENGWNYDVVAYPKNDLGDTPQPTKTADEPEEWELTGDGNEVLWTISTSVPASALGYKDFTIEDVVSDGLEFNGWGEVVFEGVTLEAGIDYEIDGATIEFLAPGLATLSEGGTLTVGVETTVTQAGTLENTANIVIDNNPYDPSGTTNWATLAITKIDGESDDVLAGAEFDVLDKESEELLGTLTTDAAGNASITVWVGNDTDTYRDVILKETKAPAGYVLADGDGAEYRLQAGESVETSITSDTVTNTKQGVPALPLTGAQGTLLFTIVGIGLIGAGAAAVAVRRSRADH